jgi:hypothetical protein
MNSSEESQVFALLGEYTGKGNRCFVAEFFLNDTGAQYVVRSTLGRIQPADQLADT